LRGRRKEQVKGGLESQRKGKSKERRSFNFKRKKAQRRGRSRDSKKNSIKREIKKNERGAAGGFRGCKKTCERSSLKFAKEEGHWMVKKGKNSGATKIVKESSRRKGEKKPRNKYGRAQNGRRV